MSASTTIHIKTDIKTRDEAKKVAEEFGFSLTSLVNAILRQIARNKRLSLSLEENPTPYMIESLKQSEADVKAGIKAKREKTGTWGRKNLTSHCKKKYRPYLQIRFLSDILPNSCTYLREQCRSIKKWNE